MKKPQNFSKIDHEIVKLGATGVRIEISNTDEAVYLFQIDGHTNWKNCIIFELLWDKNQYNVKICNIGDGAAGWYLHEQLPLSMDSMRTVERFKDFVLSNMYNIANNVDLTNKEYNMAGVTDLSTTGLAEIKHSVQSSSGPNTTYEVTENVLGTSDWSCTCPAFMYSKTTPQTCKHIKQLKP